MHKKTFFIILYYGGKIFIFIELTKECSYTIFFYYKNFIFYKK
jgi:hypothetical protein